MQDSQEAPYRIIYSLPHPHFFTQLDGVGGHIAHAVGGVLGWHDNGADIYAVVPAGSPQVFSKWCKEIIEVPRKRSRLAWNNAILRTIVNTANTHRADLAYIRYAGAFAPWLPRLGQLLGKTPLILEVNSLITQRTPLAYPLDRLALKASSDVVTISDEQMATIERVGGKSVKDRIYVMQNAVDHTRFRDAPNKGPIERKSTSRSRLFRIGYVGVIKPDYGLELLLDAYREIRKRRADIELVLCGVGSDRERLGARVNGVQGVQFVGAVPFNEIPNYLKSFDIAVYPTTARHAYQCPIKLFEYMAAGCAIVAAGTPVTRKLLNDGKLGVLYEVGDLNQLVEAIHNLLDDSYRCRTLGQLARKEAIAQHTWNSRFNKYIDHLNKIGLL